MHRIDIPDSVVARVIARRGRAHVFDDLAPARTALVVIDLQNAFMDPALAHALVPGAADIVPNVNRLAASLRDAGGVVAWVRMALTAADHASWSVICGMTSAAFTAQRDAALAPGSPGHELWPDLDVRPDDLIVEKSRFSAFIAGSSDIEAVLRARGIDTILVTGTLTNVCCESTARDAMMRNFRVVMVSDANAAVTDEEHNAALVALYLTFTDLMSTEEVINCIASFDSARAAE